jgi:hypothetical protein
VRFPEPPQGPLPPAGPNTERLIDELLHRLDSLQVCEHHRGDFAMWISARPDHLLCNSCYRAAQQAPGICCAACQGPAVDPDHDAIIVAKINESTGAHLYLCHTCHTIDMSASYVS